MKRYEKVQHLIHTKIKGHRTGKHKVIIEENKIEIVIENVPLGSFTVLDFMKMLRSTYPEDWENLVKRFGRKRRYTVTTYLSDRLAVYSQKPTQSSFLSPDTDKANSPTIGELLRRKGKPLEANGSPYTERNLRIQRNDLQNHYNNWNSTNALRVRQAF